MTISYHFFSPTPLFSSPLITMEPTEVLPISTITQALFEARVAAPVLAVQTQPLSSTNFLHELDRITQEVVTVCYLGVTCDCVYLEPILVGWASSLFIFTIALLSMSFTDCCTKKTMSISPLFPSSTYLHALSGGVS